MDQGSGRKSDWLQDYTPESRQFTGEDFREFGR